MSIKTEEIPFSSSAAGSESFQLFLSSLGADNRYNCVSYIIFSVFFLTLHKHQQKLYFILCKCGMPFCIDCFLPPAIKNHNKVRTELRRQLVRNGRLKKTRSWMTIQLSSGSYTWPTTNGAYLTHIFLPANSSHC